MRAKIEARKKATTKAISLYPDQRKYVVLRSSALGMGVSEYFQRLLEHDREHNLIADILHNDAKEAAK